MNNIEVKSDYIYLNKENINSLLDNKNYIIDNNLLSDKLEIIIPDGFTINIFIKDFNDSKFDLTFIQNNNSNLSVYFSVINNQTSSYKILNYVNGSDNKTVVKGRIFNDKDADTTIEVNGLIKSGTVSNDYTEDVRGLNLYSNNLVIKPNLIVSTNEVVANHMVSISNFDDNKIQYLKEKGINNKKVEELLLSSFLNEIFPKNIK